MTSSRLKSALPAPSRRTATPRRRAPRGSRRVGTRAARARSTARPRAGTASAATRATRSRAPLPPPLERRVVEPRLDERLCEAVTREVGTHAEPEPYLVAFPDEVEEPD